MNLKSRKRQFVVFAILSLLMFLVYSNSIPQIFIWNVTASVPKGLYLIVERKPSELHVGDYVSFKPTAEALNWISENVEDQKVIDHLDSLIFLKQVGAMSGDTYEIVSDSKMFYAKDKYIGQASEVTDTGNKLPVLRGKYIVPDGMFLPVGENPNSFDGRYTGPVKIENVIYRVIPIFIEFHW